MVASVFRLAVVVEKSNSFAFEESVGRRGVVTTIIDLLASTSGALVELSVSGFVARILSIVSDMLLGFSRVTIRTFAFSRSKRKRWPFPVEDGLEEFL